MKWYSGVQIVRNAESEGCNSPAYLRCLRVMGTAYRRTGTKLQNADMVNLFYRSRTIQGAGYNSSFDIQHNSARQISTILSFYLKKEAKRL